MIPKQMLWKSSIGIALHTTGIAVLFLYKIGLISEGMALGGSFAYIPMSIIHYLYFDRVWDKWIEPKQ